MLELLVFNKELCCEVYIRKREFLSFQEAREIVRSLNLRNQKEWLLYCKTTRPQNIPSDPKGVYKNNGWINLGDWLGTVSAFICYFLLIP